MANHGLGPVELAVLTFPGTRIAAPVVDALREVVDGGHATLIDLIYLAKDDSGDLVQVEIDEPLHEVGLDGLAVEPLGLVSDADLDMIRDTMDPGTSAVVVVYEQTWARRLAGTVAVAGGELALHVQVPRDAVDAALAPS
ncbi:hypothetical protein BJY24_000084 [Nocardia transvalensis]|uniref:DUF1269 domain-containing protein n=1 Tax=Nocardia transvalensis TaxID=37333 RepID=A0A7W9P894_9NOCA|nr:DUF6325 family protein [Nocardia transvalensis]MBB5911217.1 hypothetical protein [Nocardia transvalensis]